VLKFDGLLNFIISLRVGSAIAWNTSRLMLLVAIFATDQLQIYAQLFGCATLFLLFFYQQSAFNREVY